MANRRRVVRVVRPERLGAPADSVGGVKKDTLGESGERKILPEEKQSGGGDIQRLYSDAIIDGVREVRSVIAKALGDLIAVLANGELSVEEEALILRRLEEVGGGVEALVELALEDLANLEKARKGADTSNRPSQMRLSELRKPAATPAVDDGDEVPPKSA